MRLEEGHLRTFDVRDPLQLQVRRDFFVEGGARGPVPRGAHARGRGIAPVQLVRADRDRRRRPCRRGRRRVVVRSWPRGTTALLPALCPAVRFSSPSRWTAACGRCASSWRWRSGRTDQAPADGEQGAQQPLCEAGLGKPVTEYRYVLRSGAAEVGADVLGAAAAGGVVRFVSGRASVDFGVVGRRSAGGRRGPDARPGRRRGSPSRCSPWWSRTPSRPARRFRRARPARCASGACWPRRSPTCWRTASRARPRRPARRWVRAPRRSCGPGAVRVRSSRRRRC